MMTLIKRWVANALNLFPEEFRSNELVWLVLPGLHSQLVASRRAALIISRTRAVAAMFAVLTLVWMPVDFISFPTGLAVTLAAGRIVAGAAFAWLALSFAKSDSVRHAYGALVALYAIPTAFYLFSFNLLYLSELGGLARAMIGVYTFLPIVVVAGLSLFPLTLVETLVLAAPVFVTQAIVGFFRLDVLDLSTQVGTYWLLLLVTVVASLACMSQLSFMVALMGQAMRDPLTRCFSRASTEELLELQFIIATRTSASLSVAFVDLDNFKSVNDNYGHDMGDAVLVNAANRIRITLRRGDMVGRWGGEEFVVIFPNSAIDQTILAIERLRSSGLGTTPDGRPVTASIGVAERITEGATHWKTLVEKADQRMYMAKRRGKDRLVAQ